MSVQDGLETARLEHETLVGSEFPVVPYQPGIQGVPEIPSPELLDQIVYREELIQSERNVDLVLELGSWVVLEFKEVENRLPDCDIDDVRYHRRQIEYYKKDKSLKTLYDKAIDEETQYFRVHEMTPEAANAVLRRFPKYSKKELLLTAGEEVALAKTLEMADATDDERLTKRARDRFTLSNTGLVKSIAKKLSVNDEIFEDLVQEGFIGLSRAIDKFDWRREMKFSTYATWWIFQSIKRSIPEKTKLIRVPDHRTSDLLGIFKLEDEFGDELEKLTGIKITDKDRRDFDMMSRPASLDAPVGDGGVSLSDFVPDSGEDTEQSAIISYEIGELRDVLDALPANVRQMLESRFGIDGNIPASYREIGENNGLSPEMTRRKFKSILDLVRVNYGLISETSEERAARKRKEKIDKEIQNDPELALAFDALDETQRQVIILRRGLDGKDPRTYSEIGKILAEQQGRDRPYTYEAVRYMLNKAENRIRYENGQALLPLNEGGEAPLSKSESEMQNKAYANEIRSQFPDLDTALGLMDDSLRFVITMHAGLDDGGKRSTTEIGRLLAKHNGRSAPYNQAHARRLVNRAKNIVREVHGLPLEPVNQLDPVPETMAVKEAAKKEADKKKLDDYRLMFPNLDHALSTLSEPQRIALTLRRGLDGKGERPFPFIAEVVTRLMGREQPYTKQNMRRIVHRAENLVRNAHDMPQVPLNKSGKW